MHQKLKMLRCARARQLFFCLPLLVGASCQAPSEQADEVSPPQDMARPPAASCHADGLLVAKIIGSINADLNWGASQMRCENMLRPEREGVRLRFSGEHSQRTIAILLALPALTAGESGVEVPTNVTVTVEGTGRFFGTPDMQTCWTEVRAQDTLESDPDTTSIQGALFCVGALGEINGNDSLEITELTFSSRVNWSPN